MLITTVCLYYVLIFGHWNGILRPLITSGFLHAPPIIAQIVGMVLFAIPVMGMKVGWWSGNRARTRMLVCFSLGIVLLGVAVLFLNRMRWTAILESTYMNDYHGLWIGIIVGGFYLLLFRLVYNARKIGSFLNDFKAFPIASPVFCFGAPAFWNTSLSSLGLSDAQVAIAGAISFACGIIFVVSLVLYFVSGHLRKSDESTQSSVLVCDNLVAENGNQRNIKLLERASLGAIMLGLAGITFVCIDIGYSILLGFRAQQ
ncbi:MAG: hypothetical protein O7D91_06450 [Planctomycetota bacterium]|nr:hypothetical protein [Planctomycetota bacterium]